MIASSQPTYARGAVLVMLSSLVASLGIVCVRGAEGTDPWQFVLWRAVGFGLVLAALGAIRNGPALAWRVARMGPVAFGAVAALVVSQAAFIVALGAASTAEVFFLMSLAPLMTAVLAWPLLGERIGLVGAIAICIALAGVAVMLVGLPASGAPDAAIATTWTGRWMALVSALAFALYALALRRARTQDVDPILLIAGPATVLAAAAVLAWRGLPLASSATGTALALANGALLLSVSLVLFARGSRVVPAAGLILLAQVETIAAPVWAWLFFGEATTLAVVVGGSLILAAVVLHAYDGARRVAVRDEPAAPARPGSS